MTVGASGSSQKRACRTSTRRAPCDTLADVSGEGKTFSVQHRLWPHPWPMLLLRLLLVNMAFCTVQCYVPAPSSTSRHCFEWLSLGLLPILHCSLVELHCLIALISLSRRPTSDRSLSRLEVFYLMEECRREPLSLLRRPWSAKS